MFDQILKVVTLNIPPYSPKNADAKSGQVPGKNQGKENAGRQKSSFEVSPKNVESILEKSKNLSKGPDDSLNG
jgi:hypothetical protein